MHFYGKIKIFFYVLNVIKNFSEHFPYFTKAPEGWKNSVRHNLSLSRSFLKIEVETSGCHGR